MQPTLSREISCPNKIDNSEVDWIKEIVGIEVKQILVQKSENRARNYFTLGVTVRRVEKGLII